MNTDTLYEVQSPFNQKVSLTDFESSMSCTRLEQKFQVFCLRKLYFKLWMIEERER